MSDVVFVGDSVTWAGYMDPSFPDYYGDEGSEYGYANRLIASIPTTYPKTDATFSNIAEGSRTTYQWAGWVDSKIAPLSPRLVIIMLGINDSRWEAMGIDNADTQLFTGGAATLAGYQAAFRSLIDQVLALGSDVVLITPNRLEDSKETLSTSNTIIQPYVDEYATLATEYAITAIDVNANVTLLYADYCAPDGIHPNAGGHLKLATYIEPLLADDLPYPLTATADADSVNLDWSGVV